MSSPPAQGSGSNQEKRRSLGQVIQRVRTTLRRGRSHGGSVSAPAAAEAPAASSTPAATSQPAATSATTQPTVSIPIAPEGEATRVTMSAVPRTAAQREKARALFEKYGLTLEADEWPVTMQEPGQRVEKLVRIRIRRTCHRCQTVYGHDKVCTNCGHTRCKKCPRYPVKKSAGKSGDKTKADTVAPKASEAVTKPTSKTKHQLTLPSRTGGQDVVLKSIRRVVRRTCHQCDTLFTQGEKTSSKCGHVRCGNCPREPAHPEKYPHGYPHDAPVEAGTTYAVRERIYRKPKRKVKWTCHNCSTLYRDRSKVCENCQHERCGDCTREPPKKIRPPPDPEIVRSLQEKLAQIELSSA